MKRTNCPISIIALRRRVVQPLCFLVSTYRQHFADTILQEACGVTIFELLAMLLQLNFKPYSLQEVGMKVTTTEFSHISLLFRLR